MTHSPSQELCVEFTCTHNFHFHSQKKAGIRYKQSYIQFLICQVPAPYYLQCVRVPRFLENTYSCSEALEIWCLQHESIKHFL